MTLQEFLETVYAVERSLRPNSRYQYETAANAITRWAGEPVMLDDLCDDMVNKWLAHLAGAHLAPATIRNRRQHLMALWHAACDADLAPHEPRRIRRESMVYNPPRAWTHEEVQQLLGASENFSSFKAAAAGPCPRRSYWNKETRWRRTFWGVLIRVAWDTGLRGCDILGLDISQIEHDGKIAVMQSKTGRLHLTRVHPETVETIRRTGVKSGLLVPWNTSEEFFRREFNEIVSLAGIWKGTFKTLRKSSATEVELLHPGCGAMHLGHVLYQQIARTHYLDPRLLIANKPMPRPLRTLPEETKERPKAG